MTPMLPRHIAIIMDGNGRWAEARAAFITFLWLWFLVWRDITSLKYSILSVNLAKSNRSCKSFCQFSGSTCSPSKKDKSPGPVGKPPTFFKFIIISL